MTGRPFAETPKTLSFCADASSARKKKKKRLFSLSAYIPLEKVLIYSIFLCKMTQEIGNKIKIESFAGCFCLLTFWF